MLDCFKKSLYFIIYLFLSTLFVTLIYSFTNISSNAIRIILLIIAIIGFSVMGFYYGRISNEKGYKSGLKIGFVLIIELLFFSFLFKDYFSISKFIYYFELLLVAIASSVIGINLKKK